MTSASLDAIEQIRHPGPPLGLLAVVFVLLFLGGLYPVTIFGGSPHYPGPFEPPDVIVAFFQARPAAVLICSFLQFGAAIPLGLFTATAVSRLQFLGVKAAGSYIALFGGFATAFHMLTSSAVQWTMTQPAIAHDRAVLLALYWLVQGTGGTGFSVPFGLLIAGISVSAGLARLLPRWIMIFGLAVAICGELSWINLVWPRALFLVPLTRFPGFIWMIAAGFALPTSIQRAATARRSSEPQQSATDAARPR